MDTTKSPSLPFSGAIIEENKVHGKLKWNPENFKLYLSEKQKTGYIQGHELRKEVEKQNPLNATVLDWLVEHPEEYPEEWKGKYIYFWGTIFRDPSDDDLCVRCGYWDGDRVVSSCYWLDDDWRGGSPAASSASSLNSKTKFSSDTLPFALPETLTINGITYIKKSK